MTDEESASKAAGGVSRRVMTRNCLRGILGIGCVVTLGGLAWRVEHDLTARQFELTHQASDANGRTIRYLLDLPRDYRKSNRRWPLILSLHGAGERGEDLDKVRKRGLLVHVAKHDDFPFVVVSPQCSAKDGWNPEQLGELLDDVQSRYRIDEDRVYVTGYSMGGFGTWALAVEYPDRFAAIAPICGGGAPSQAEKIKHVPAWVFHGGKDKVVPATASKEMVKALREAGGDPKLTIWPRKRHGIWNRVYSKSSLYEWLLSHRRP
jgi:predicted peptidase